MGRGGGHTPAGPWQRGASYGVRATLRQSGGKATLLPGALLPPTPYGRYQDVLRPNSAKVPLRRLPTETGGLDTQEIALAAAIHAEEVARERQEKALNEKERAQGSAALQEALQTQMKIYENMARINFAREEYPLSAMYYEKNLEIARVLKDKADMARSLVARSLGNMANACARFNDLRAEQLFRECILLAEKDRDHETQYKAYAGLQAMYRKRKHQDFDVLQNVTDNLLELTSALVHQKARRATARSALADTEHSDSSSEDASVSAAPPEDTGGKQGERGLIAEAAAALAQQAEDAGWAGVTDEEDGEEEKARSAARAARMAELEAQRKQLLAVQRAYEIEANNLRAQIESRTKARPYFITPVDALIDCPGHPRVSQVFLRGTGSGGGAGSAGGQVGTTSSTATPTGGGVVGGGGGVAAGEVVMKGVGRNSPLTPMYAGNLPHLKVEHVYGSPCAHAHRGLVSPRRSKGRILVYAATGMAVVHDILEHTQKLYVANDGRRVVALTLHPDDDTVASCHMDSTRATLRFWKWSNLSETSAPLDLTQLCLKHKFPPISNVVDMTFSVYGDLLLLLLQLPEAYAVVAVEWRKELWLAYHSHCMIVHKRPSCMACNWSGDGALVVVGVGRISTIPFERTGEKRVGTESNIHGVANGDMLLCAQFLGERVVAVGSSSGVLFLCDTLKLQTMFKLRLHAAALWDISVDSLRVVTVGGDAMVNEWYFDEDEILAAAQEAGVYIVNKKGVLPIVAEEEAVGDVERLEQSVDLSYHVLYGLGVLQAQEVSDFGSLPLRQWGPDQVGEGTVDPDSGQKKWDGQGGLEVRSVCLLQPHEGGVCGFSGKPDRGGIVVGTRTNELYALSGTAQVVVTLVQTAHGGCAHDGNKEPRGVSGLSCHPSLPIFATAASDGSVRVWSADSRRMLLARVAFSMPSDPSAEIHKEKKNAEEKKKAASAAKTKKGGGEEEKKEKKRKKKQGRYTPTVLCYSDDGSCIAVGFACGSVAILQADTLEELCPPTLASTRGSREGARGRATSPKKRSVSPAKKRESDATKGSPSPSRRKDARGKDGAIEAAALRSNHEPVKQIRFMPGSKGVAVQRGSKWFIVLVNNLQASIPYTGDSGSVDECSVSPAHGIACITGLQLTGDYGVGLQWLESQSGWGARSTDNSFAHCQEVTCVCWLADGGRVITVGGLDLCVVQWRLEGDVKGSGCQQCQDVGEVVERLLEAQNKAKEQMKLLLRVSPETIFNSFGPSSAQEGELKTSKDAVVELYDPSKWTAAATSYVDAAQEREAELASRHAWKDTSRNSSDKGSEKRRTEAKSGPADGERFAVCKSTVFADKRWRERVGHHQAPENSLELEWVNGYHGHDSYAWLTDLDKPEIVSVAGRCNLHFVADEKKKVDARYISFFVSAVGVVMDLQLRQQYFFKEHDAEISVMAIHPSRTFVATGQRVSLKKPRFPPIYVWCPADVVANNADKTFRGRARAKKKEVLAELVGICENRIGQLSFSVDGRFLMAIGTDVSHRFACYNWADGTILFQGMAGVADLMMMTALPFGFAVCGNKETKIWEHPALGSRATADIEGIRWMVGLAPLSPCLVECIVAIDDPASNCGASVVIGYPNGFILVFQQLYDEKQDAYLWEMKNEGSRYWEAHPDAAVKCLAYAAPDVFCNAHGCHNGLLISADAKGAVKIWKIEPKKADNQPAKNPKAPEPLPEVTDLSFSMYRYHDIIHPRRATAARAPQKHDIESKKGDIDSMVDVAVNPVDPIVPLRICAHKIDYLPGESGALLIGTSANSVVMVLLSEHTAPDYQAEVLLEAHTGSLHALAAWPCASLSFFVGLQNQDQHIYASVSAAQAGLDINTFAVQAEQFPTIGSQEEAERSLQSGHLVAFRFDVANKKWLYYNYFGTYGGEFVEYSAEETCMPTGVVQPHSSLEAMQPDGRMTQGRAKVTLTRKLACLVQQTFKPNAKYAKKMGSYVVEVRTVESDEVFPVVIVSRKQLKLKKEAAAREWVTKAEIERKKVQKGDIFLQVGDFDIGLQMKLRRVVSRLAGVGMTAVAVQKIIFKQNMPLPDPRLGIASYVPDRYSYEVMLRVNIPINRQKEVSELFYKTLLEKKVSKWILVRKLVFKGVIRMEAAGRQVVQRKLGKDAMNPFELELAKEGLMYMARPVSVPRWQQEHEPRTLYLTCGDDSILRGWDALEKRCVVTRDLGFNRIQGCLRRVRRRATCMTLSPIGPDTDQWLAIGYKGGLVSIHHIQDLAAPPFVEIADRKEEITDLKFAPAGSILAVASAEREIDLYAKWYVPNDPKSDDYDPSIEGTDKFVLQRVGVCRGHSSAITHMDFSDDTIYLRSNDASGEVFHWSILDPSGPGHTIRCVNVDSFGKTQVMTRNLATKNPRLFQVAATIDPITGLKNQKLKEQGSQICGKLIESPQFLNSTDWASDTCPLAWNLRAIWRPRDKVGNIASVARSSACDVVACGYNPIKINLGTINDATSAREEAAAKYNLVAARLMGPAAQFNVFTAKEGSVHRLGILDTDNPDHPPVGIFKKSISQYSAVVNDFHTVKLFRFPAVGVPSSAFMRDGFMTGSAGLPGRGPATRPAWYEAFPTAFRGHASKVVSVAFSPDDLWLFTCGGSDCSVFQWRHSRPLYLRWWINLTFEMQAAMRERFARVIPRINSESAALPVLGGEKAGWQSEAHYIFVCFQRKLLEKVGFSDKRRSMARSDVLRALNEQGEVKELLSMTGLGIAAARNALEANAREKVCSKLEFILAISGQHLSPIAVQFFHDYSRDRNLDVKSEGLVQDRDEILKAVEDAPFPPGRRLKFMALMRGVEVSTLSSYIKAYKQKELDLQHFVRVVIDAQIASSAPFEEDKTIAQDDGRWFEDEVERGFEVAERGGTDRPSTSDGK